jgi:uncharacterized membrane protein
VKRHGFLLALLLAISLVVPGFLSTAHAQTPAPVVRAVLFYSPTCPHCEYVITETLPPLVQKYRDQLQIVGVDVTQLEGRTLFLAALQRFGVEAGGVPFLVIGGVHLMGSQEIPERLPGLVDSYLSQGGVDWPDIPGLREAISQSSETGNPAVATPTQPILLPTTPSVATAAAALAVSPGLPLDAENPTWMEKFARDPAGNILAVVVLAGMFASLAGAAIYLRRQPSGIPIQHTSWLIPFLCMLGLGVAVYLTYVETVQVEAVCGPVGDCNTVQQSEYARLFGVLPIGLLGIMGYAMIMLVWLLGRSPNRQMIRFKDRAIFGMTALGILFSIYLTFLEPFVIGASCAWCLASAVIMTLLFLLSLPAGSGKVFQN